MLCSGAKTCGARKKKKHRRAAPCGSLQRGGNMAAGRCAGAGYSACGINDKHQRKKRQRARRRVYSAQSKQQQGRYGITGRAARVYSGISPDLYSLSFQYHHFSFSGSCVSCSA